jgi:hypothetical protein
MLRLRKLGLRAISWRPVAHHGEKALGRLHTRKFSFDSHECRKGKGGCQDHAERAANVQDPTTTLRGGALRTAGAAACIQTSTGTR